MKGRIILDCSTLLPGPFIGKLLASMGAQVIKIENPDRPDGARSMGAYYKELNECKELCWLNLTQPEHQTQFRDLVKKADALIEGFRPQAKKKLGLDVETLHRINPKLCIASLVGYPEDGPWKDRAGHDLNFQAVTGCLSLFSEMPGLPLADMFASYSGALKLCALLDDVSRGAPGARVVISMSEVLKEAQGIFIREFKETGQLPHHGKTLISGLYPCYRVYLSQDGRKIAVGAIETKFWDKVCEILELRKLSDKGYVTGKVGEKVVTQVQKAFGAKPWSHWAPLFDAADCCVEPVLDYSQIYPGAASDGL
jgi:alpha-methylacyl-CoA racemase